MAGNPERFKELNKTHTKAEQHGGVLPGFGLLDEAIIESLPVGVVIFDRDLKIVEANPQAAELIELDNCIDESLAKGDAGRGGPKVDWTGELRSILSAGKTRTFENISYALNGKTKQLRIICLPLGKTKTRRILGGTVIIEDATEKVNMQRQLADVEKLAAVGKLASKVAHELNNPIDGILRYINLTLRIIEGKNLEKPREYLAQCRQGLMRMVRIVSELLEFSRNTYAPFEYVSIEQIVEDAIKTMGPRAEVLGVEIVRKYATETPEVRSGNLFQVFCNLIKNALDAMPDGGKLSISTKLTGDDTVAAEFRDTGTGFAPEHAEAIFEPFFTTKEKGKGTGLGLSICKDIVERHRGHLTAEPTPGRGGGSIFTVYLPVTSQDL